MTPKFRVDKISKPPRVWLLCSECSTDIRQIGMDESIEVNRAYHCTDCQPENVITLNPPVTK